MSGCHHPRRLVHGVCDVVIAAGVRQARMYAHAHAQLLAERPPFGRQGGLRLDASVYRGRGIGERDEECVALGLYLAAGEAIPDSTEQGVVMVQHLDKGVTQATEQPCRTFDVREDERHAPRRERSSDAVVSDDLAR